MTDTAPLVAAALAFRADLAATRSATKVCDGDISIGRVMAYDVAIAGFDNRIMPLLLAIRDEAPLPIEHLNAAGTGAG